MTGQPLDLAATFGGIDIYLFDQLQRGRIQPGDRILDAGCGFGRNIVYLMRSGYDVYAADADPDAIAEVRRLAAALAPGLAESHFRVEPLESLNFPQGFATVVICSAVLHFASNDAQFEAMLRGSWRMLASGGMFFCRLASSIGMEGRSQPIEGRRYRLLDGTARYLVDEPFLMDWTARLGGKLLDPLKTTVVQGQRAMTTWVIRKD